MDCETKSTKSVGCFTSAHRVWCNSPGEIQSFEAEAKSRGLPNCVLAGNYTLVASRLGRIGAENVTGTRPTKEWMIAQSELFASRVRDCYHVNSQDAHVGTTPCPTTLLASHPSGESAKIAENSCHSSESELWLSWQTIRGTDS